MNENEVENLNKILYVNGGMDFDPIDVFYNAKEYIYVDTMPRAEKDEYRLKGALYRGRFIDQVISSMLKKGFVLSSIDVLDTNYSWKIASMRQKIKHGIAVLFNIGSFALKQVNPTKYTFISRSLNKTVKYYMNTNIKYNMNAELRNDIMYSDTVVVSNSVPNHVLLTYFYNRKVFVTKESGFSATNTSGKTDHIVSTIKKEGGDTYFYKYLLFNDDWSQYRMVLYYNDI